MGTEQVRKLIDMLDEFENNLTEVMRRGEDLVNAMKQYGGDIAREGEVLNLYLVNRLRNFLECNEMFRFDEARDTLEEEIEEIEAGVCESRE